MELKILCGLMNKREFKKFIMCFYPKTKNEYTRKVRSNTVCSWPFKKNILSIKLLEKNGFKLDEVTGIYKIKV